MSVASYQSLITSINTYTKRPDLANEIASAVRKATMKIHLAELWKRDLVQAYPTIPQYTQTGGQVISLGNPPLDTSYRYSLDLTDSVTYPLIRKIDYIREYNNPLTGQEWQFNELDVDSILDDYKVEQVNYWYRVGQAVQLRATKILAGLEVGYYKYPNVIPANYDSWIADVFPDAIVDEACAIIFKMIGKDNEYQRLAEAFEDNLHYIQMIEI